MAVSKIHGHQLDSGVASADLSDKLFYFCVRGANGAVNLPSAAGAAVSGIITEAAVSGRPVTFVTIASGAIANVVAGGTVAVGDKIATDANGKAVKAVATNTVVGVARKGGAAGAVLEVYLDNAGILAA